jgi:hypothetical protein
MGSVEELGAYRELRAARRWKSTGRVAVWVAATVAGLILFGVTVAATDAMLEANQYQARGVQDGDQ